MLNQLTERQKLILIIIGGLLVLVSIVIILFFITKSSSNPDSPTTNTIIIDNRTTFRNQVSEEVFSYIGATAYGVTITNTNDKKDVYHGVIRDDTFLLSNNGNIVSFILDIPEIQLSWSIRQAILEDGSPFSDTSVECITEDKAIYPVTSTCIDINSGGRSGEQQKQASIASILPLDGPTYRVVLQTSTTKEDSYALFITYYGDAGKQDALEAIRSLGFEPNDYEIIDNKK